MRYLSYRKSLTCYIALLYLFDNKNKHLVVWDLSYGHIDSVTYGKESHPVFQGATKTRGRFANDDFISKIFNDSIT